MTLITALGDEMSAWKNWSSISRSLLLGGIWSSATGAYSNERPRKIAESLSIKNDASIQSKRLYRASHATSERSVCYCKMSGRSFRKVSSMSVQDNFKYIFNKETHKIYQWKDFLTYWRLSWKKIYGFLWKGWGHFLTEANPFGNVFHQLRRGKLGRHPKLPGDPKKAFSKDLAD